MRSSRLILAVAATLAIGFVGMAGAPAADKEQVLKDRQARMKEQGADLGAVKGFLDGKNDQAKAVAAATDLVQSLVTLTEVFPPGTAGPSPDGKYATKPDVWSDWDGFNAVRSGAAGKADGLMAATKTGDKAAIQAAFADLGKNGCGGCHGKFREEIKK